MLVRRAQPADAASIARIYNQALEERIATFETEPRTPEQIVAQMEAKADHYPTVVVERQGQVIAWAGMSAYRGLSGIDSALVVLLFMELWSEADRLVLALPPAICETWKSLKIACPH